MKNILTHIAVVFIPALFIFSNLQGQYLVKKNLRLEVSYGSVNSLNPRDINKNGTVIPSVLGYMENNRGLSLRASYTMKGFAGINLSVSSCRFDQWEGMDHSDLYESARMNLISIKPGIFVGSPFREKGIFNRLRVELTMGPSFEFTVLHPGDSFPWLDLDNDGTTPETIKDNAFGLFSDFSVQFAVSQLLYFKLYYEIERYWGTNALLSGNGVFLHSYGLGIGFRFITDKYYLYE